MENKQNIKDLIQKFHKINPLACEKYLLFLDNLFLNLSKYVFLDFLLDPRRARFGSVRWSLIPQAKECDKPVCVNCKWGAWGDWVHVDVFAEVVIHLGHVDSRFHPIVDAIRFNSIMP